MSPGAHAQSTPDFEAGYVVTAAGDTLRGEIQNRIDLENVRSVHFRDGSSHVTVYEPDDLRGYGFDGGRRFLQRVLSPGPGMPAEPLFLQVLVEGEVSLYALSDRVPSHLRDEGIRFDEDRYALEHDGRVTALYVVRRPHETDRSRMVVDRQYVRVLAAALAECAGAWERAQGTRYTRPALVSAVVRYHECVDAPVAAATTAGLARRRASATEFGIHLSGGARRIAFQRRLGPTWPDPESYSGGPGAGYVFRVEGIFEYRMHDINSNFSVPLGLSLSHTTTDPEWSAPFFRPDDFDRFQIAASAGITYTLLRLTASPYVSAGLLSGYLLGEKRELSSRWYGRTQFPAWEAGWYVELGGHDLVLSRVKASLRYEVTGIGHGNPLYAPTKSSWRTAAISGGIGFRF